MRRLPVLELLAAFAGANLVFSRFEATARASVARGVMDGLYDLKSDFETSRSGALKDVPREVRARIRSEIDLRLQGVGLTRADVERNVRDFRALREFRTTVVQLRRLG